ncbi:hypothetical protein CH63R_11085 [Colletotrichum higginsianum IMI 349063]|uniref:Uncharacterized protein n=2 Tax=Colletotrichum higginsianum TaxID=80884 RepID=A0A1B7XX96_COLHI|nr:hypothetical protein CH63R_11085 [Colletotrichum higginsianum IMI 349063]OBR04382.1 hypothetical protein CH63R_11085 [Colletotrichum higginsianum IMI 349063]TIC89750.1 hypothetical protein CH35J_012703 [Colletotrichum higginsianum]GJC99026.1 hypothetical protein ColKHC_07852 [Colletotrichum higginsianum]
MAEKQDAIDGDDDWHTALRGMGISDDMRQRIMNPEFTDIRLTGSASYWALDILQEAFDFLSVLSDRIDKKYKSDNINCSNTPDESDQPRPAILGGRRARTGTSSASNDTPTPSSLPPKHIDGRTMLFKGGSESRLSEAIDENRGLLIGKLYSTAPTDFHPSSNELVYLTKHHDVALLYARYKAECLPPVKAAVLHIAIPNQLIGDGREIYGDHWRDLIWNSRNKKLHARGIRLPGHLNQYLGVDVLVSNLCSDSTEKITRRMEDKSELTVSKLPNGEKASQHVIQTLSRQTEIANQTVGYVWISPYTPGSGSGSK